MSGQRIIVAMTGASGTGYGLHLLKGLQRWREEAGSVHLIVNSGAKEILACENDMDTAKLAPLCDGIVDADVMDHPLASGSNTFRAMVISPCTVSTASKIASGIADNLITRCAAVALKERRRLILLVRETPLSTPVLKALYDLSAWGVIIMPASPPFYGKPASIKELQSALAGRILDLLDIENDLIHRYTPDRAV